MALTYSSALRNSLDSYLTSLTTVLKTCSTLRSGFENNLAQDFDYWQTYRLDSLVFFNAVNDIQRGVLQAIDALDDIRHAHDQLNAGDDNDAD